MGPDQHIPHSPQDPSTLAHLIHATHSRLASHNLYSPEVTHTDRPETSRFPDETLLEEDYEAHSEVLLQPIREFSSHWQDPDVEIIDIARTDEGPFWGEHTAETVDEGSSPWEVFFDQKHQSALDAIEPGDNGEEYQAGFADDHPYNPTDDHGALEPFDNEREWSTASDERIDTGPRADKADSGHEYDHGCGSQEGGPSFESEISSGEGPAYAAEVSGGWHKQAVHEVRSSWSTDDTLQDAGTVDVAPAWTAADICQASDLGPTAEAYDIDHVHSGDDHDPDRTWMEDEQGATTFGADGTRRSPGYTAAHHEPYYDQPNEELAGQSDSPYGPDDAHHFDSGDRNHDVPTYIALVGGCQDEELLAEDDRTRHRRRRGRGDWIDEERAEYKAVDNLTRPSGVEAIDPMEARLYYGNPEDEYASIGQRADFIPPHGYEYADPQSYLSGAEQDTRAGFDQRYEDGNTQEYEPGSPQAYEHEYENEIGDALEHGQQQPQMWAPEDGQEYEQRLDPQYRFVEATMVEQGKILRNEDRRDISAPELDPWREAWSIEARHTRVVDLDPHSARPTDLYDLEPGQNDGHLGPFKVELYSGPTDHSTLMRA